MDTYLILRQQVLEPLPDEFNSDGRFSPELVKQLISTYTKFQDNVFDPFCGFGTVIREAEQLERNGYGVEKDFQRYKYACSTISNPQRLLLGDIALIDCSKFPKMDLCITSPTYAWRNLGCNPFTFKTGPKSYDDYLSNLTTFFQKIVMYMKNGSHIIVDASNVRFKEVTTTLAWDIKDALCNVSGMSFDHEIVVCWEGSKNGYLHGKYGFGYDHSYCLVFNVYSLE